MALDVREELDRVQDSTGRLLTAAGTAVAGVGMLVPQVAAHGLAAAVAATAAGLVSFAARSIGTDGLTRASATGLYALPGASLSALLGWEAAAGAPHWGMAAGLMAWACGTWMIRPAQAARQMIAPTPSPAGEVAPVVEERVISVHPAAHWWETHVAVKGGAAPGTVLQDIHQDDDGTIRALITAQRPGEPVPSIPVRRLSALLDIPEEQIKVEKVPGRGAGVRMLVISPADQGKPAKGRPELTAAESWERDIAPVAMEHSKLTDVRHGPGGVVELHVEVPRGKVIKYDHRALVSAFGVEDDPTRLVVETDGYRRAIITLYPRNPLATIRPVTRDDLVMDRAGYITVGLYHNGRPAHRRLYDPETGSAQRFILWGTTGAGKSRALQLQLIAEKINGIVTWLADLKEGQSVPEAVGQVDWRATTPEAAIVMLRAAVAVAHTRMRRYGQQGRSAFTPTGGEPLLHVHIDEANRLLDQASPYRDEATVLIREIARTGRSVGVGIGIAAQASHLEELGGSDTLRGLLKEGEVTLLRWSSSMMQQLATSGLLPPDVELAPIPKRIGAPVLTSQFDEEAGEQQGEGTQGMGYLLSGSYPTSLMRHFRLGSVQPQQGLDPEILALYGDEPPASLGEEDAAAAGKAYHIRHDENVVKALFMGRVDDSAPAGHTAEAPAEPMPAPTPAAPRTLQMRVLEVLEAAGGPMSVAEVLVAVNADGGRQVVEGSIRNTLSALTKQGRLVQTSKGIYELTR